MNNTFLLLRHGESVANRDKLHQGWFPRLPLTEQGIKQAETARDIVNHFSVDAIYSSPILRTVQTAKIINTSFSLPIHLSRLIIEYRRAKKFEGKHFSAYLNDPDYLLWKANHRTDPHFALEDGESLYSFHSRIERFIQSLQKKHDHQTIVVVSHSEVVKYIIKQLTNEDLGEGELQNAGVYKLEAVSSRYAVSSLIYNLNNL